MDPTIIGLLILLLPIAFLVLVLHMCKILNDPGPDYPAEYQLAKSIPERRD